MMRPKATATELAIDSVDEALRPCERRRAFATRPENRNETVSFSRSHETFGQTEVAERALILLIRRHA